MAADPRNRGQRQFAQQQGPRVLDLASPKHFDAFNYGPAPLVLSGGFNSAKTVTFCLKMLYIADLYPGYRWLIVRNIWDELRKTTLSTFFKFCPPQAYEHGRRSDIEKILVLNNGSSFIYAHLDDPEIDSFLRGFEANGALFDQMEEINPAHTMMVMKRLGRWDQVEVPQHLIDANTAATGEPWPYIHPVTGRAMPPTYFLGTCNPGHKLHPIYEMFHPDAETHHEKRILVERKPRRLANGTMAPAGSYISYFDLGYRMIEVNVYDNKFATEENIRELEMYQGEERDRFLLGKWGSSEGTIHNLRADSILQPTPAVLNYLHSRCYIHRTLDHGDAAPTCCLWDAVDGDGNVFFFQEYYKANGEIHEHRDAIHAMSKDWDRSRSDIADPSIRSDNKHKKTGELCSVQSLYADIRLPNTASETAIAWELGDNNELGTRQKIAEYLRPQGVWDTSGPEPKEVPRLHPITHEKGFWPRIFFVKKTQDYPNGCDHAIKQIQNQMREKVGVDVNGKAQFSDERSENIVDHAYDCSLESTRYTYWDDGWVTGTLGTGPRHGWVLTPYGPQQYHDLQCYKKNVPMVKVLFRNGASVTTTPDHMFLTPAGWVEAANLLPSQSVCRFSTEECTDVTRRDTSRFNLSMKGRKREGYIAMSMSTLLVKYRKTLSSITRMKTKVTTILQTLRQWAGRSMRQFTMQDVISLQPSQLYVTASSDGRQVKWDAGGMKTISDIMYLENSTPEPLNIRASHVEPFAYPRLLRYGGPSGASPVRLISSESVVESVKPAPSADAWCLTVDHPCHAFLVEDGIVISNCVRYRIAERPALPHASPKRFSENSFMGWRARAINLRKNGRLLNMAKRARQQAERR